MILIEPKLKICNLNFSKIIKRNLCICFIVRYFSCVQLFATPQMVAYQALPSMGFSRQEYWSGLPFPSPADLPKPGIKPRSPALQTDALSSEPPGKPFLYFSYVKSSKVCMQHITCYKVKWMGQSIGHSERFPFMCQNIACKKLTC